jgi:hypothetical protein
VIALERALDDARVLTNEDAWSLTLALFARLPDEGPAYRFALARDAALARVEGRIDHDRELAGAWFCAFGCGAYLEGGADALEDVAYALAVVVGEQEVASLVHRRARPGEP